MSDKKTYNIQIKANVVLEKEVELTDDEFKKIQELQSYGEDEEVFDALFDSMNDADEQEIHVIESAIFEV